MKDNEYETIDILTDLFTYITVGAAAIMIVSLLIRAAFQEKTMTTVTTFAMSFHNAAKEMEALARAISSIPGTDQFNENGKWRCDHCGSVNNAEDNNCPHCGAVGSQLI